MGRSHARGAIPMNKFRGISHMGAKVYLYETTVSC